ncbi:MAG: glycosyltransferase family 39 protein [Roseiflexaceae bacterium]|nr:glycosyltransferase family 39 protein [Roseiflexus sp.]MDW8212909.1 glycosyltransferase family 39 protein [Roseiflexaceae bacterium]
MTAPSSTVPRIRAGDQAQTHIVRHTAVATALATLSLLALLVTEPQIGLTWDEPAYIVAARSYVGWFELLATNPGEALQPGAIKRFWEANHEHPPLDKIWSGIVWQIARHFLDDLPAHRLGNILLTVIAVGVLYATVASGFGGWAGVVAVVALMTMPRFFFHAHLAALDVPAAVVFFLVTMLFWHTRKRRSIAWDIALGAAWGAALATKINALFVLPMLFAWMLAFARHGFLVRRTMIAGVIGLPTFVALWPWLYHDTRARLIAYIRFITVDHWKIAQWYFGEALMPPPWHFPFVMLIAVTPLAIMLMAFAGVVRGVAAIRSGSPTQREQGAQIALWALGVFVPLLALTTGRTMVYDNERLFMPAFFFVAALAGVGLDGIGRMLRRRFEQQGSARRAAPVIALAGPLLFMPHLISATQMYPHLLSYYSETVGGLRGATRMGLETTYWCETYAAALPYINAHAAPGAVVWVEDWSHDVLLTYQFFGRLRPDVRVALAPGAGSLFSRYGLEGTPADIADADYVIVMYRQTGFAAHPKIERWIAGRQPVLRLERSGIPLMELYEQQQSR